MNSKEIKILESGIAGMKLEVANSALEKMLHYLDMLQKWNKVFNLTAIRQREKMLTHHLLDSLSVLPYMFQGKWLDVGCGAGLPGLVLGMARPDWQFSLIDSNSKKTSFVQQAIIELGLKNIEVSNVRAEEWAPHQAFDGIISRAFAESADFVALTRHLLAEKGYWLAMKGHLDKDTKPLPDEIKTIKQIDLKVPGIEAMRSLVILSMDHK